MNAAEYSEWVPAGNLVKGLFAIMCFIAIIVTDVRYMWLIVVVFVFYGINLGALDPVSRAFVAELATPEYKATGLGFYQMAVGLASLPASVLAGVLWDIYGAWAPFALSCVLSLSACVALVFVHENREKKAATAAKA